jgi:hypothetical protein
MNAVQAEMRMNEFDRSLKGPTLSGVYLAADGSSSSGTPRDDDPHRHGIDLGDMLEMGLESLFMHFRRKPEDQVMADDVERGEGTEDQDRQD